MFVHCRSEKRCISSHFTKYMFNMTINKLLLRSSPQLNCSFAYITVVVCVHYYALSINDCTRRRYLSRC